MKFIEKPPLALAQQLLQSGSYWNAGMFLWRPAVLRDALRRWLPGCAAMLDALDHGAPLEHAWPLSEATSIDYGVMEPATATVTTPAPAPADSPDHPAARPSVHVLPVSFGWSDVGSWSALPEVLSPHPWGVGIADHVLPRSATANVVHAPGRVVALLGVRDLMIVDTGDVLLVGSLDRAQQVRDLLDQALAAGLDRLS